MRRTDYARPFMAALREKSRTHVPLAPIEERGETDARRGQGAVGRSEKANA